MISFGLIKGEALRLCTRRSGEPHIDNETVSIAPRFQNTTPSYGSVMNQIAGKFPPRRDLSHRVSCRTALHPSATLGKLGAHLPAARSLALEMRCDRESVSPSEPTSAATQPGKNLGDATPSAAARASANSRLCTGRSSDTL